MGIEPITTFHRLVGRSSIEPRELTYDKQGHYSTFGYDTRTVHKVT